MTLSSHTSDGTPALAAPLWRARPLVLDATTTLATFSTGSDDPSAPALVLVHGLGHWTQAAWDALVPFFAATHRIVAFDLPGFGASSKPDRAYPLAFFTDALGAVVDAYALDTFALAGHSLGGLIAADYAARRAERVRSLALLDPAGFLRTPKLLLRIVASRPVIALMSAIRPSRGWVRAAFETAVYDARTIPQATHDRMYELARETAMRRAFARVYRDALREFFDMPALHARLARYRGPTLIVWGREDRYVPLRALAGAEKVYPHATVAIFGRCGHCPNIELPAQLAGLMRATFAEAARALTNDYAVG